MPNSDSHKKIYSFLLNLFAKTPSTELKFKLVRFIGEIASKNFLGFFKEPIIEDFLKDYSFKHLKFEENNGPRNSKDHIVHIFTTTYQTGGHTRFVENLIQLDKKRTHHLLITEQWAIPARLKLLELVRENNGNILFIEPDSIQSKAILFQKFILENAGTVMLHIHPFDFLPSLSLYALKEKIEILFFNHADHCFSFGTDVAHKIINIRKEAHNISVHYRGIKNSVVLPLPIIKGRINENELVSIRLKYGIDEKAKIAISIGSAYKFQRKDKHYFFRTIYQAVEKHENLKVLIVGVDNSDLINFKLDFIPHERICLMGIIEDPSEIQAIADIVLDPMPFGSYTALLETTFYGAYPLVCYDTIALFDLYKDPSFESLIQIDKNESDYLKHLDRIISGEVQLTREQIKINIEKYHCSNEWLECYDEMMAINEHNESNEIPLELERLSFLNEEIEMVKYRLLSFFYENIQLLNKREVLKFVLYLISNNYKTRETLGIVKKIIYK